MPATEDKWVDYVVQYRVRIRGRAWGKWSVGEPMGGARPDAAISFVEDKNRKAGPDEQWRVVQVTRTVIYP